MRIWSFLITVLIADVLIALWLPVVGNQPQVYYDIIVAETAMLYQNKSGELQLFWNTLGLSIILFILTAEVLQAFFTKVEIRAGSTYGIDETKHNLPTDKAVARDKVLFKYLLLAATVLIMACVCGPSLPAGLLIITFIYCVLDWFFPRYSKQFSLLTVMIYYAVLSIIAVVNLFYDGFSVSSTVLYIITGIIVLITCAFLLYKKDDRKIAMCTMFSQITIPLILLMYIVSRYSYNGSMIIIPFHINYYIIIITLTVGLIVSAVIQCRRAIRLSTDALTLSKSIFWSTAVTIFVLNSYISPALFVQTDLHHHGEQSIPWQQIFELGQVPYKDFFPVSGLFPLVTGFFQEVVLGATATDYASAAALVMILFGVLTITLCWLHTGSFWALLLAAFFSIPVYNRQYMILPVLLILLSEKLIRRPNSWLQVWLLCCFLAGLYYPLYGGAILLGTMPFALVQIYTLIKGGSLKTLLHTKKFYLLWSLCLLPIVLSVPLLLRMARHVLTYSSQTVLADGIAIYGSTPPPYFLHFLADGVIRDSLFYIVRISLPIIAVLVFVYFLYGFLRKPGARLIEKLQSPVFFALSSGCIILPTAFTYSLVRADIDVILSRTAPVLAVMIGMFLPIVIIKYGAEFIKTRYIPVCLCIMILSGFALYGVCSIFNFPATEDSPQTNGGFRDDTLKARSFYTVSGNFAAIDEKTQNQFAKLGKGFIDKNTEKMISEYDESFTRLRIDENNSSVADLKQGQLLYYLLNIRASVTGNLSVAKSYDAQHFDILQMEAENPIFSTVNSLSNYYIYYWMVESGYVYSAQDDLFLPRKLYEDIYGEVTSDMRNCRFASEDLGFAPASLGNSIDTLRGIFSSPVPYGIKKIECNNLLKSPDDGSYIVDGTGHPGLVVEFEESIPGSSADWLYLDLEITGGDPDLQAQLSTVPVSIRWECEDIQMSDDLQFIYDYASGKALVPLGADPAWLLSENTKLSITFNQEFPSGTHITVNKMQLLKLIQDRE